jgi:hypothetical protein
MPTALRVLIANAVGMAPMVQASLTLLLPTKSQPNTQ